MNFCELNKNFEAVFKPINKNERIKIKNKTPNYSLEKMGEGTYMLSFPVPGLDEESVSLHATNAALTISVRPLSLDKPYVYKGFEPKGWTYTFKLKDNLVPHLAYLKHGVLYVELFKGDSPMISQWKAKPYFLANTVRPISVKSVANEA